MPFDLIREIGILKKTAALVNQDLGKLPKEKANIIVASADEVIAGKLHEQSPVRYNDTFPTAMDVAAAIVLTENLAPALKELHAVLEARSQEYAHVVKTGRTLLPEATPLTWDQEVSGWSSMIELDLGRIRLAIDGFYALAIGATAVGTGLNTHPEFAQCLATNSRLSPVV
jgi:fumarate hydratase, class II